LTRFAEVDWHPRYNVAPSQTVETIISTNGEKRLEHRSTVESRTGRDSGPLRPGHGPGFLQDSCISADRASRRRGIFVERTRTLARDVVFAWALCVWIVASDGTRSHVSPRFTHELIGSYLRFLLKLAERPVEISRKLASDQLHGTDAWRDHFVSKLVQQIRGGVTACAAMRNAADGIDWERFHFARGKDWLYQALELV
jgi:hypothetical protein